MSGNVESSVERLWQRLRWRHVDGDEVGDDGGDDINVDVNYDYDGEGYGIHSSNRSCVTATDKDRNAHV